MSDNIKVVVKVRPLIPRELEEKLSYQWRVKNNTLYQLDQNGRDFGSCFTFDQVYDTETKTSDIYNDIAKPIVEAATAGFNGTIFAYGQTSSGKTYTMTGTEDSPGIIPLAVFNLFEIIKNIPDRDFLVRVSYIEIYNETVKDLLNDKKNVKVHETLQGVKVDCTEQVTTSPEEVLKYLKEGEANRQTGATNMNEESSRSHSIFQITIESREHIEGEAEVGCVNVSQLNLVDLAGSERAGQTGATGIRFREGTHINKSLSTLALVIKQLSEDQNKHVNYRDSKLTRILQNSLGGNAKTSIICAITPAAVEETISTLQFANRAKAIKNKPEVNAVATDATMIQSLTKQLSKLQSQLESKKNLEVMLESKKNVEFNLQKQIAALQRLILNGFGQRSSMDMMAGSRRKLVPPRRITISTLHPIEENPVPSVPKFHTPLLKYNPMVIPGAPTTDFVPIQNASKGNSLSCLPEESENRLITPPPYNKKVNFNDEIIELDSDDDNSALDIQTCSPYHKCYGSSKTPPCVLRKNAKQAEKNLKDIVELTEREKIYTPSVIELIEKLEQNNTVITRLQDEVQILNMKSKEKDMEIDSLKVKVSKSNDEIRNVETAKAELEALCKEYTTKLTDWEVSFDTLKSKSKRREDELLSLLDEQKVYKKQDDNSKLLTRNLEKELNFMDMSKDISLVNSDNESSVTNLTTNDDETTSQVQDLVKDMQNQIQSKNQSVLELEADLLSQKQRILSLENTTRESQKSIEELKELIHALENERDLLTSTVHTLNSTIKSQKATIESANNDIESYNSLIQELQIKLTNKDKILDINITENYLEKMIANEEKFIANNDNMKNIIHSFKIALVSRNKEIESLKSAFAKHSTLTENESKLQEQLKLKETEIEKLNSNAFYLQDQIDKNIATIDNLMKEKTNLTVIEQQLTSKLSDITEQNSLLEKLCNERTKCVDGLKASHDEMLATLTTKDSIEKELQQKHEDLDKQIGELNLKVVELKKEIEQKDNLIATLKTSDLQSQEYLTQANSIMPVLENILRKFSTTSSVELCSEMDNVPGVFTSLKDHLTALDTTVTEFMSQKELELGLNIESNNNLKTTNITLEKEVGELKDKVETLEKDNRNLKQLQEDLSKQIITQTNERDKINEELQKKKEEITELETNLNSYDDNNESLRKDILAKEHIIASLTDKVQSTQSELDVLKREADEQYNEFKQQIEDLRNTIESKDVSSDTALQEKDTMIVDLQEAIKKAEKCLEEKSSDLERLHSRLNEEIDERNNQLQTIFELASIATASVNIEFENNNHSTYDKILLVLNKLGNHTIQIHENNQNATDILETNENLRLQIKRIQEENKVLNDDMFKSNEIISSLRKELNEKANEIENMVAKAQELKDNFTDLDLIMKEQLKSLQADKDHLEARCSELELNLNDRKSSIEIQNIDDNEVFSANHPRKSLSTTTHTIETVGPPSLLTICCNKIVEYIQPNEDSVSPSDSNTSIEYQHKETQFVSCECPSLLPELKSAQIESVRLQKMVEQLEAVNRQLISEHEAVRREIQLLAEPAYELQKKIASHKTNLSTLTATTYAENKSLRSQVKVLQHHHSRFHNVCQKDLPVVKKQLFELLTILKGDPHFDRLNASFKRYSLPIILDNNGTLQNAKNESTLDGDLLMLDTNLTLTTSADNTLMDQTCLDMTQAYANHDFGCQTDDLEHLDSTNRSQVESLTKDNIEIMKKMEALEMVNKDLQKQINDYSLKKAGAKDAHSSPIKAKDTSIDECLFKCEECESLKEKHHSLEEEFKLLAQKLRDVDAQRSDFENKYKNLSLEIPSTDALVKKLNIFEKELSGNIKEITRLKNLVTSKNEELKLLQQENDALSNQLMENISETDDLNKELDNIKDENAKLVEKCKDLEKIHNEPKTDDNEKLDCSQCQIKDVVISTLKKFEIHSKLNRSLSDSDTSSRYNKICTLQHELHAGREDCKELTEEVATIKNHLERSNLTVEQNMDLDESMGESNIFTITKHFDTVETQLNRITMPNVPSERQPDIYSSEKLDCITFYVEKTGADKENLDGNVKIIDVMKLFYNDFVLKHNNEVENLVNKIKCFEESKKQLEGHVNKLSTEYSKLTTKLEEKENNIKTVTNSLSQIRQNITLIQEEIMNLSHSNNNTKAIAMFKEKLLNIIDKEFELSAEGVFDMVMDSLVSKHENALTSITNQYSKLQEHMESVTEELNSVKNNLLEMKSQLTERENQYNLLKAQKEKIHEISNAVTLDLVRKEQELCQTIVSGCKKLVEHNVLCSSDFDNTLPIHQNINTLFDRLLTELKNQTDTEKEKLTLEIKTSKAEIEEQQKDLQTLKLENDKLKEEFQLALSNVNDKDNKLEVHTSVIEELNKRYQSVVEENSSHLNTINVISQEIKTLKETLLEKETALQNAMSNTSEKSENELTELYNTLARYKQEIDHLKSVNEMILKEKELAALELEKSRELLKSNKLELDKMTSDLLVLRESVKDNVTVIDNLKQEAKSLLQQNIQLKEQFEAKCQDCSRLEMNIKTHEKTAEIQSKMIIRLQKQKEDVDKALIEKNKHLEELTQKCSDLTKDCEVMKNNIKTSREELDTMKSAKEALEMRISEMEMDLENGHKPRLSMEATADTVRRRRQSIHDSKRMFSEKDHGDHNKMDAVFESRSKPADLFMDVDDDDSSNGSTPRRNSKGRDSVSKHDQSEEPVSRPSSVAETRRRRQSIHDLHRSVRQTPSPHERYTSRFAEINNMKTTDDENNYVPSNEVSELRERLTSCQQELEELREQYRELDEECETCAQYLRERDDQCARLKKEKAALEGLVSELKEKLQSINPNRSQQEPKTTFCHAAVNTDEDWSNLHSVVVDRMSFDAEVDKNKRLTKTIEDLRFKKQDLKLTIAKMQKALEKHANKDHSKELEHTKAELKACKQELKELKERYKELDEECETCSQYLRERDEQCRKLKEAKAALEAKLAEYTEESGNISLLRKKRHSAHDQRRPAASLADADTQIADDFLNNQVERDDNSRQTNDDKSKELKHLKMAVERLSQQKAALEQQLATAAASAPVYVATGSAIVQTQQLSDVMKENQKLKKINTKLIDICKKRGKKTDFVNED
ncbi:kinesin-related protein 4-like [Ostrinia nubilalis]|uniref:kinesin-related protein 4-like n=1 Tax=Ostrinia nubilalis TaxID=29057 RepID=UPI00308240C5